MMKKLLTLLAVCGLLSGTLAGCTALSVPAPPSGTPSGGDASSSAPAVDTASDSASDAFGVTNDYLSAERLGLWWQSGDEVADSPVFYAAPDEGAEVISPGIDYFYLLEKKDGWLYGCWGNWLGWIREEAVRPFTDPENPSAILPLPSFLTPEQRLQFLRATGMFDAYICRNNGLKPDYAEDGRITNEKGWEYVRDTAFASYGEFDAALRSLFTPEYLDGGGAYMGEGDTYYMEHENQVYMHDGSRGSWSADVEGYTLTSQTEDKITFDVNLLFQTEIAEHRASLPAVMVKTADGWRFDDFTGGSDDIRWMEKMGPDFDPWEGKE